MNTKLSPIEQHFIEVWTRFLWVLVSPLATFALVQVEIFVWVEFSYDFGWSFLTLFWFGIWVTGFSLVSQILNLIRFDYRELWNVIITPFDVSVNPVCLITDNQNLIIDNQVKYTRTDLN